MSDEPRDHAAPDESEPPVRSSTDGGQTKPDLSWWKDESDQGAATADPADPVDPVDPAPSTGDDEVEEEAPPTSAGEVPFPIPLPSSSTRAADEDEAQRVRREERRVWRAREEERRRETIERQEAERAENEARRRREAEDARRRAEQDAEARRQAEQEAEARRQAEEEAEARRQAEAAMPPPPTEKDLIAEAKERSRQRTDEEAQKQEAARRDFEQIAREVEQHLDRGYELVGLVGYSGSGKSHFLQALSLLLRDQGFEVAEWKKLRKSRVPGLTEAQVFYYPVSRGPNEKWVLVDAGGELYARLTLNDWQLADDSAGLLHALHHCKALFLLLHLQPEHFRLDSAGEHRWMTDEEKAADQDIQNAQEELEFFDQFLLFLRALFATDGAVGQLVKDSADKGLDESLRTFRDKAPKLEIPVQVLFSQADKLADSHWEVAEAIPLSPRRSTADLAPFVTRHLKPLMTTMLEHAHRFRFDFVQSYEEKTVFDAKGVARDIPEWGLGDELLSCGALPAFEFLVRNMPAEGRLDKLLQRFEIDTRQALQLDRLLRPSRWGGLELPR